MVTLVMAHVCDICGLVRPVSVNVFQVCASVYLWMSSLVLAQAAALVSLKQPRASATLSSRPLSGCCHLFHVEAGGRLKVFSPLQGREASTCDSPFNVFNTSGWVLFGNSFSAPLDWSAGWRGPGPGSNPSAGLHPAPGSAAANRSPPPLVYSKRSNPVGMRQITSWSRHQLEVPLILHRPLALRWDPPPGCSVEGPFCSVSQ